MKKSLPGLSEKTPLVIVTLTIRHSMENMYSKIRVRAYAKTYGVSGVIFLHFLVAEDARRVHLCKPIDGRIANVMIASGVVFLHPGPLFNT